MGKCTSKERIGKSLHSRVRKLPASRSEAESSGVNQDETEKEPFFVKDRDSSEALSAQSSAPGNIDDVHERLIPRVTGKEPEDATSSVPRNGTEDDYLPDFPVLDPEGNPRDEKAECSDSTPSPSNVTVTTLKYLEVPREGLIHGTISAAPAVPVDKNGIDSSATLVDESQILEASIGADTTLMQLDKGDVLIETIDTVQAIHKVDTRDLDSSLLSTARESSGDLELEGILHEVKDNVETLASGEDANSLTQPETALPLEERTDTEVGMIEKVDIETGMTTEPQELLNVETSSQALRSVQQAFPLTKESIRMDEVTAEVGTEQEQLYQSQTSRGIEHVETQEPESKMEALAETYAEDRSQRDLMVDTEDFQQEPRETTTPEVQINGVLQLDQPTFATILTEDESSREEQARELLFRAADSGLEKEVHEEDVTPVTKHDEKIVSEPTTDEPYAKPIEETSDETEIHLAEQVHGQDEAATDQAKESGGAEATIVVPSDEISDLQNVPVAEQQEAASLAQLEEVKPSDRGLQEPDDGGPLNVPEMLSSPQHALEEVALEGTQECKERDLDIPTDQEQTYSVEPPISTAVDGSQEGQTAGTELLQPDSATYSHDKEDLNEREPVEAAESKELHGKEAKDALDMSHTMETEVETRELEELEDLESNLSTIVEPDVDRDLQTALEDVSSYAHEGPGTSSATSEIREFQEEPEMAIEEHHKQEVDDSANEYSEPKTGSTPETTGTISEHLPEDSLSEVEKQLEVLEAAVPAMEVSPEVSPDVVTRGVDETTATEVAPHEMPADAAEQEEHVSGTEYAVIDDATKEVDISAESPKEDKNDEIKVHQVEEPVDMVEVSGTSDQIEELHTEAAVQESTVHELDIDTTTEKKNLEAPADGDEKLQRTLDNTLILPQDPETSEVLSVVGGEAGPQTQEITEQEIQEPTEEGKLEEAVTTEAQTTEQESDVPSQQEGTILEDSEKIDDIQIPQAGEEDKQEFTSTRAVEFQETRPSAVEDSSTIQAREEAVGESGTEASAQDGVPFEAEEHTVQLGTMVEDLERNISDVSETQDASLEHQEGNAQGIFDETQLQSDGQDSSVVQDESTIDTSEEGLNLSQTSATQEVVKLGVDDFSEPQEGNSEACTAAKHEADLEVPEERDVSQGGAEQKADFPSELTEGSSGSSFDEKQPELNPQEPVVTQDISSSDSLDKDLHAQEAIEAKECAEPDAETPLNQDSAEIIVNENLQVPEEALSRDVSQGGAEQKADSPPELTEGSSGSSFDEEKPELGPQELVVTQDISPRDSLDKDLHAQEAIETQECAEPDAETPSELNEEAEIIVNENLQVPEEALSRDVSQGGAEQIADSPPELTEGSSGSSFDEKQPELDPQELVVTQDISSNDSLDKDLHVQEALETQECAEPDAGAPSELNEDNAEIIVNENLQEPDVTRNGSSRDTTEENLSSEESLLSRQESKSQEGADAPSGLQEGSLEAVDDDNKPELDLQELPLVPDVNTSEEARKTQEALENQEDVTLDTIVPQVLTEGSLEQGSTECSQADLDQQEPALAQKSCDTLDEQNSKNQDAEAALELQEAQIDTFGEAQQALDIQEPPVVQDVSSENHEGAGKEPHAPPELQEGNSECTVDEIQKELDVPEPVLSQDASSLEIVEADLTGQQVEGKVSLEEDGAKPLENQEGAVQDTHAPPELQEEGIVNEVQVELDGQEPILSQDAISKEMLQTDLISEQVESKDSQAGDTGDEDKTKQDMIGNLDEKINEIKLEGASEFKDAGNSDLQDASSGEAVAQVKLNESLEQSSAMAEPVELKMECVESHSTMPEQTLAESAVETPKEGPTEHSYNETVVEQPSSMELQSADEHDQSTTGEVQTQISEKEPQIEDSHGVDESKREPAQNGTPEKEQELTKGNWHGTASQELLPENHDVIELDKRQTESLIGNEEDITKTAD